MQTKQMPFGPGAFDTMTLWQPEGGCSGVILLLHGLTEYAGRYEGFARRMTGRGLAVAGFNFPGHGGACLTVDGAPRPAYCGGEGSWQELVEMLDRAARFLKEDAPERPVILLGFSLGSFVARAWLARQTGPLPADRLLLAGTGGQPAGMLKAVRAVVRRECRRGGEYRSTPLIQKLAFGSYNRQIKDPVSPYDWLLAGPDALRAYEADPLVCREITGGLFRELLSCMIYVDQQERRRPCPLPVAFLSGQDDPVGECGKGVYRAAANFPGAPVVLTPGRHDILHDRGCERVYEIVLELITR